MTRQVSFHRLAQLEVVDASVYYASIGDALGAEFLDEVERASRLIAERPEIGPVLRNDVRKKVLLRFPYTIFYTIRAHEIRILAVGHQKRRPFYWRGRK